MGPANGLLGSSQRREPRANFPDSSNPDSEVGVTEPPSQDSDEEEQLSSAWKKKEKAAREREVRGEKEKASQIPPQASKVGKPKETSSAAGPTSGLAEMLSRTKVLPPAKSTGVKITQSKVIQITSHLWPMLLLPFCTQLN